MTNVYFFVQGNINVTDYIRLLKEKSATPKLDSAIPAFQRFSETQNMLISIEIHYSSRIIIIYIIIITQI